MQSTLHDGSVAASKFLYKSGLKKMISSINLKLRTPKVWYKVAAEEHKYSVLNMSNNQTHTF